MRNHLGSPRLHSRRSYSYTSLCLHAVHADLLSLCWAAHNMKDLQQKRVIFEFSSGPLSNALRSPEAFSLYNPLFQDLQLSLIGLESWSLRYVPSHENMVASQIADSIVRDNRRSWYVSSNGTSSL